MPLEGLLPLLYPDVPDLNAVRLAAQNALGRDCVAGTADLRTILGHLDRQFFPSPVSVAFRAEDVSLTTVNDLRLALDRADGSVSAIIRNGPYEPHVSAVLADYCMPGMSAVDAGANVGYHTVALARLVGTAGRVIAIEPSSENCRLLVRSLQENAITNVDLFPVALAKQQGWAYFTHHLGSNGGLLDEQAREYSEGGGVIVPTFRLDELVDDQIDLLKMDLEGGEGLAIQGAMTTLGKWRPIVLTELSFEMLARVSKMEVSTYLSFFTGLGYQINVIDRENPGALVPVDSPTALIDEWKDELQVEDLLLLPDRTSERRSPRARGAFRNS